ncbi:MAG: class I SAM-dependent rRNA methyltransferase [bacterium]
MYKKIEIAKSARNAVKAGHPWIFSGKIISPLDQYESGETVYVYCEGSFLGTGFVSPKNSICVRMISRAEVKTDKDFFVERFNKMRLLKKFFLSKETNMYRLCFSEGDFIPGLIVDDYDGNLVIQTNSAGAMRNRNLIVEALVSSFSPASIIDRTDNDAYRLEKFERLSEGNLLYGSLSEENVIMKENGILFYVDIMNGHKTGFYLDQRENREIVSKISSEKRVLNLCSYTGGFTLYSLIGGASSTVSVDISSKVLNLLDMNVKLNNISSDKNLSVKASMFDYVANENIEDFDIIIIDPPAFAKHLSEARQAEKAYKFINGAVLKKAKSGALILTSSCTSVVTAEMFANIIEQSIKETKRDVKIMKKTFMPPDHPVLFHFKEAEYLKSFLLCAL